MAGKTRLWLLVANWVPTEHGGRLIDCRVFPVEVQALGQPVSEDGRDPLVLDDGVKVGALHEQMYFTDEALPDVPFQIGGYTFTQADDGRE